MELVQRSNYSIRPISAALCQEKVKAGVVKLLCHLRDQNFVIAVIEVSLTKQDLHGAQIEQQNVFRANDVSVVA